MTGSEVLNDFSLVCKMSPYTVGDCQLSIVNCQFEDLSGGYCSGVPPLPIPNREVKPACADGTAMQCGRVGGRHFLREPWREISGALFVYAFCH